MRLSVIFALTIIIIPALLFIFEFYLCKKASRFALILPIIVACFFVVFGIYAIITSAIMFLIYFILKHIEKQRQEKQSELNRMNIQDLE